ncbi:MAG: hypothetical protein LBK53_08760 [Heliobacteriaceae bacterium]|jgi:repressor LexA|nr:hypothetical protein [Heliobacteriaceae bacterium]
MSLHHKQQKLLDLLYENQDNPLTLTQLVHEMGETSNNAVLHHLKQLEKKGYLKRNPNNSADYQIILEPGNPVVYLQKYGSAKCGSNAIFVDSAPIETIPISPRLINCNPDEAFILEASGDSMAPLIYDKDLVICQKCSNFKNEDIIACSINGEAKIKKFFKVNNDLILLKSLNTKYLPIAVQTGDDLWVGAKVIQIIKNSL